MMFSRNYNFFIVFILIVRLIQAEPIDFSDCGSEYGILEVDIEGCKNIPCNLQMGNYYKISLTLRPTFRSTTLTQEAYVTLFESIDVAIDVLPDDPCHSLSCPVQISDGTKFQGRILIGNDLMAVKGTLWWKMHTDTGKSAVCVKTVVQIQKKKHLLNFLRPK